jgi:hypothetical protein
MGLRVIIGYPTHTKERPFPVYVGNSAAEAAAARESNTSAAHFEIIENPNSYRKANGGFQPPVVAETAAAETPVLAPLVADPEPRKKR